MSFPWIKVFNNLPDHPKSDALASALGSPRAWTHLVELWLWASRVKPDGNLAGVADLIVAKRAGWEGDPVAFVDALTSTGWLTPSRMLNDWEEHQGAVRDKAISDREKAAEKREAKRGPSKRKRSPGTGPATPPGTGPGREERRGEEKREEETRRDSERESARALLTPEVVPPSAEAERARALVVRDNRNERNLSKARSEAIYGRPQSADELLAMVGPEGVTVGAYLAGKFELFDDVGDHPSIHDRVATLWSAFRGQSWGVSGRDAIRWLATRLSEDHQKLRQSEMIIAEKRAKGVTLAIEQPTSNPERDDEIARWKECRPNTQGLVPTLAQWRAAGRPTTWLEAQARALAAPSESAPDDVVAKAKAALSQLVGGAKFGGIDLDAGAAR